MIFNFNYGTLGKMGKKVLERPDNKVTELGIHRLQT